MLVAPPLSDSDLDVRTIDDGFLIQRRDQKPSKAASWEAMTRQPTEAEVRDLEMAWTICAHTKSNAIVIVKDGSAIGVGAVTSRGSVLLSARSLRPGALDGRRVCI